MQWQHGGWVMNANGSLSLTPIPVDGRQLLSKPCDYEKGIYTRYNQSELFKVRAYFKSQEPLKEYTLIAQPQQYEVLTDPYHGIPRLNLYEFDGTPMQPMYLVYSPPEMLPTTTLNPTTASATATGKSKRGLSQEAPINWKLNFEQKQAVDMAHMINADRLWWIGLAFTGIGGLLYFGPRRLGLRL